MKHRNTAYPNDKSNGFLDSLMARYKLTMYKELSERIGIHPYVISRVLNGKQELSKFNKHDISVATGISIKKIDEAIEEGAK